MADHDEPGRRYVQKSLDAQYGGRDTVQGKHLVIRDAGASRVYGGGNAARQAGDIAVYTAVAASPVKMHMKVDKARSHVTVFGVHHVRGFHIIRIAAAYYISFAYGQSRNTVARSRL